jgi:hypothetical protein
LAEPEDLFRPLLIDLDKDHSIELIKELNKNGSVEHYMEIVEANFRLTENTS